MLVDLLIQPTHPFEAPSPQTGFTPWARRWPDAPTTLGSLSMARSWPNSASAEVGLPKMAPRLGSIQAKPSTPAMETSSNLLR